MKTQMTDNELGLDLAKLLGGAAAGALLMYILDPDRGGARRAHSVAAVRHAGSRTSSALGNVWRGAGARLGATADGMADAAGDRAADLAAAAKPDGAAGTIKSSLSRLGHAAGEVLDDTISKAKSVAGRAGDAASDVVSKAGSAMSRGADTGGDLASRVTSRANRAADLARSTVGSGIDDARTGLRNTLRATDWRATARNPAVLGGGLLGLYGLARRSPLGLVLGLAGAAMLARGVTGQPLRSLLSTRQLSDRMGGKLSSTLGGTLSGGLSQTIDFEKSIHIDASPEEVYDLWNNYENFPRFMSHVVEVKDLGRRRSHWVVKGPGGSEFAWNSVLTEQNRPQRLAWRSEPGAEIPQSGSIQFEPHRGGTHVTVRMSYTPPAGVIGHGLATLLGADPKAQMDDDLARMKAFVERGAAPPRAADDAGRARSSSRFLH
jgi:uncharacterized membrane protein